MKLNITFSLMACLCIGNLFSQGFGSTPTTWPIPQGGHTYSTINYGYDALADSTTGGELGDQTWSVLDINGDGRPDLVVTAQTVEFEQFSNQAIAFGTGSNRYWKVHLNNGSGFSTTAVNWPIPQGGHTYSTINYGYDALADSTTGGELGDQTWSTVDMNGDGKPDLVVTAQTVEFEQFSNQAIAFGTGSNRFWKVYLNNGSGFNMSPINWPIPQGGHTYSTINYGYDALADSTTGGELGDQTWSILDMNADGKPDLVVTAETVDVEQFSNQAIAFGAGTNRYWKVYYNTGSGFNTTATNWPIPQGGHTYSTINYGYDALAASSQGELGDQTWSVLDINADGKPDLVVTAQTVEFEQFSNQAIAFGTGSNRFWKVFLNTGSGFNTTAAVWPIPQGGHTYSTINYGYDALYGASEGEIGDQNWSVLDMNNDNRPDLVVTAQTVDFATFSNQAIAFGTGANRYWKVFLNNGSGFNTTSGTWPIPQGGHTYSTIDYGYDVLYGTPEGEIGDQNWSVIDMNNDNKPDLVVTAQTVDFEMFSNQAIAFGSGANRYWKVFMSTGLLETQDFATDQDGMAVYPNPSNGQFFVETNQSGEVNLEVVDLTGRTIVRQNKANSVDLSAFPKGIYLLNIKIGESSYTKKVILK